MTEEQDELESYWTEVRDLPKITIASGRAANLREVLEVSALKTLASLPNALRDYQDKVLTLEGLHGLARVVLDTVLKNWLRDVGGFDSASLIEVVLAGQSLPLNELKAFVRALPETLLNRTVEQGSIGSKGTGIFALLAVEWFFRQNKGRDYELSRDNDGVLLVRTWPAQLNGQPLSFRLDEKFRIDEASGVNTKSM